MFGFKKFPKNTPEKMVETFIAERARLASEETRYTPDIARLERAEFQRVFIYNEMQEGHRAHALLPEHLAELDATCYTDQSYVLWKKRLGKASQAIALEQTGTWKRPDWDQPYKARIQGELYVVRSTHLIQLDTYHRNTIEFERRRVKIVRPYFSVVRASDGYPLNGEYLDSLKARGIVHSMRGASAIEAWMYFGVETYWSNFLGSMFTPVGQFTSLNNPWLQAYYSFTKLEYDR